ncbi:MAG: hypothetical protein HY243_13885 [Proteobacteria bacterium]|nr:hypothetical protein [Pseudomonadota bacterium]
MKHVWRWVRWPLAGVAVLLLAAGGLFWFFLHHFNPDPPANTFPKPATALEAQRQDLAYFRELIALDRSFSPAARAEAERRIRAMEAQPGVVEKPKFRVALMEIVALADNGHTRLGSNPGAYPTELPIRVSLFSDGLHVMRAQTAQADLLGARVVAVDGKPIDAVMARLRLLRGGIPSWRNYYAALYIELPEVLYGAGIAPDAEHSVWTLITPSGQTIVRKFEAYAPKNDEGFGFSERWLSADPLKHLTKGWLSAKPDTGMPVTLQEFDTAFRERHLPHSCAALVQLKSNEDVDGQRIAPFLDTTEADLKAHPPCAIIMDMRYNGGGDYTNTAAFARRLPGQVAPGGKVFLLTGPSTFSAAITTTAFVKEAGGNNAVILGEPVGDRMPFFAEGNRGCLPNYPLCMNYQTGKHDYEHPCRDLDVCYWVNYLFPVRVKSLDPDETITTSFADWKAGHDPVFDRAVALAGRK